MGGVDNWLAWERVFLMLYFLYERQTNYIAACVHNHSVYALGPGKLQIEVYVHRDAPSVCLYKSEPCVQTLRTRMSQPARLPHLHPIFSQYAKKKKKKKKKGKRLACAYEDTSSTQEGCDNA